MACCSHTLTCFDRKQTMQSPRCASIHVQSNSSHHANANLNPQNLLRFSESPLLQLGHARKRHYASVIHFSCQEAHPSKSQIPPNILPDHLFIFLPPLPPHLRRLDVRGALIIRFSQHAHDADQDLLDALDGRPPLRGVLVVVRVVARGMQDRNADYAGGVDF